jgi:hypothetical protein
MRRCSAGRLPQQSHHAGAALIRDLDGALRAAGRAELQVAVVLLFELEPRLLVGIPNAVKQRDAGAAKA